MKVRALKDFISLVFGNVDEGRVLDLDDRAAGNWIEAGLVESCEVRQTIDPAEEGKDDSFIVGKEKAAASLSASHPAPVSPKQTATVSAAGAKHAKAKKTGK